MPTPIPFMAIADALAHAFGEDPDVAAFQPTIRVETWLDYDRHLLVRCDALLRVPGVSHGADLEDEFARAMDIPVIRSQSADPAGCLAALTAHFSDGAHAHSECHDCGQNEVFCRCSAGEG